MADHVCVSEHYVAPKGRLLRHNRTFQTLRNIIRNATYFPHPALSRDHAFAHGRPRVVGARRARPQSFHSLSSEKRTYLPDLTLCFRQNHCRSRRVACLSTAV